MAHSGWTLTYKAKKWMEGGILELKIWDQMKKIMELWQFMIARTKWNENRLYFITSYTFLGGINELNTLLKIRSWIK